MPASHAILVCGHAIYVAANFDHPEDDSSWLLLPYQKGEGGLYIEHARRGAELAAADPSSLLIYTGGQTRGQAGPISEAGTYLALARHYGFWGHKDVLSRAVTEDFARDSLENLLFGMCRFREVTGAWPSRVTVVTWEFKRARFDFHRQTIRYPVERFTLDGPNNPRNLADSLEGERRFVEAFRQDPYASDGILAERRRTRNPFQRQPPYEKTCPGAAGLLAWPGPRLFDGPLPWD